MDVFDKLGLYSPNPITAVRAAATHLGIMKQLLNREREAKPLDCASSSVEQAAQAIRKEQIEREIHQEQFNSVLRQLRQETIPSFGYTIDTQYIDESAEMIFYLELNTPTPAQVKGKVVDTSPHADSQHLKVHKPTIQIQRFSALANVSGHVQDDGFKQLEPSFDESLTKKTSKTNVLVTNEKHREKIGTAFLLAEAERVASLKPKNIGSQGFFNNSAISCIEREFILNEHDDELIFKIDMS